MAKIVTFGELLLRLSTDKGQRVKTGNQLMMYFGGSEMNVAVSMANFGHVVQAVTVLPSNLLGDAGKHFLQSYGVYLDYTIVKSGRIGTYYVETGSGNRHSVVVYDRAHSVFAELKDYPYKIDELLKGCDLFFVSGITLALSQDIRNFVLLVVQRAQKLGVRVAFDINYRAKLWPQRAEAFAVVKEFLPYVHMLGAGILDLQALFKDDAMVDLTHGYGALQQAYPNLNVIFSTTRQTFAPEEYELSGNLYMNDTLYMTKKQKLMHVIDRIGGGDAYCAGILHGLLSKMNPQQVVEFALQATSLKHTVAGDVNQFDAEEVWQAMEQTEKEIER